MAARTLSWAVAITAALAAARAPAAPPPDPASGRAWVQQRLVELGRDAGYAESAAARLTAEDLAVLAANPEMMQPAAGHAEVHAAGVLVVVLLVAVGFAGGVVVIVV